MLRFQDLLANTAAERDGLSNALHLWDAIPKYFSDRRALARLRQQPGGLPPLVRAFTFNSARWEVVIVPATLVDAQARKRECYPGAREELVEDALRRLAVDQGRGYLTSDGEASIGGVSFPMYALQSELARRGHSFHYEELEESLEIMAATQVRLTCPATGFAGATTILLDAWHRRPVGAVRADHRALWHVSFSRLVSLAICAGEYRQFDYDCMMRHRSQLARWLHKRLALTWTNAGPMHPYRIKLSTVIDGSGLLAYGRRRKAAEKLTQAIAQLRDSGIIANAEVTCTRGARNQLLDATWTLHPTDDYCKTVRRANARAKRDAAKPRAAAAAPEVFQLQPPPIKGSR